MSAYYAKRPKPTKVRVCFGKGARQEKEQDRKSSPCPEKTLMAVIFFCVSHISGRDIMCVSFSRDSWRF